MRKKIAAAAIIVLALPFIIYFVVSDMMMARYLKEPSEIKHKQVRALNITSKDKLRDFNMLWRVVTEGIPEFDNFSDEYGYDISDSKERYLTAIEKTESDLEYFCTVNAILNEIPLFHTGFFFPDYENITGYVCFGADVVRTDSYLKSMTKLWKTVLQGSYRESRSYVFSYTDGEYCYDYGQSELEPDGHDGVIKSINGMNPDEYILKYLSSSSVGYDDKYGKMYRSKLVFNDCKGEKLMLELETPSGEVTDSEMYFDLCDEYLYVMQPYIHGVYDIPSEFEVGYISDETDKKIVYIKLDGFSADNREVSRKIKEYCFEDGVSVILDLRENGGGVISETNSQLYSVLFSENISASEREYIFGSYGNRAFLGGVSGKFNRYIYGMDKLSSSEAGAISDFMSSGKYFSYNQNVEYHGLNSHSPDVWILVSDNTASAADYFVSSVAGFDNTVIVGENTGGEKTGCQYMSMLPESRLVFCYSTAVTFNSDGTDNSLYGTFPDIHMRNSSESLIRKNSIVRDGKDADKLQNRLLWDDTLIETVKMIKEKNGWE